MNIKLDSQTTYILLKYLKMKEESTGLQIDPTDFANLASCEKIYKKFSLDTKSGTQIALTIEKEKCGH